MTCYWKVVILLKLFGIQLKAHRTFIIISLTNFSLPGIRKNDLFASSGRRSAFAFLHGHQVADISQHSFEVRHCCWCWKLNFCFLYYFLLLEELHVCVTNNNVQNSFVTKRTNELNLMLNIYVKNYFWHNGRYLTHVLRI